MKTEDVVAACHRHGIPRVFISLNAATNCSCGHRQTDRPTTYCQFITTIWRSTTGCRKGCGPSPCAYDNNYEHLTQRITLSPSWQVPSGSSSAHHSCHPAATSHFYVGTVDTTVTGWPVSVRHQYWYGPACCVDKICKYNKKCDKLSLNTTILNKQTKNSYMFRLMTIAITRLTTKI